MSCFSDANDHKNSGMIFCANVSHPDQVENTSEDFDSGIRFSESVVSFKQVTGVENFRIVVNGLVIDSELSNTFGTSIMSCVAARGRFFMTIFLRVLTLNWRLE